MREALLSGLAAAMCASAAAAQEPAPATGTNAGAAVEARVPVGDRVHVTDAGGRRISGTFGGLANDALTVVVLGAETTVPSADVRRVVWEIRDSTLDGLLIGAGVGAIPGIYYLITDPNECTGMCPEEYGLVAAGAALGWLIDRAVTRKATVFRLGDGASVALVPYGTRSRQGVQVTLRF